MKSEIILPVGVSLATPSENRQWHNRLNVAGSSGNVYTVAQNKSSDGWACDCPSWKFRKGGPAGSGPSHGGRGLCKHLSAMWPVLQEIGRLGTAAIAAPRLATTPTRTPAPSPTPTRQPAPAPKALPAKSPEPTSDYVRIALGDAPAASPEPEAMDYVRMALGLTRG